MSTGRLQRARARPWRIARHRDEVVISTKFGLRFDEASAREPARSEPGVRTPACEASLRRLGTDRIDLYLLHGGADDRAAAAGVVEVLEALVAEGKVRLLRHGGRGDRGRRGVAEGPLRRGPAAVNAFGGNDEAIAACEDRGLAALARSPLAMGLLSGKYRPGGPMPADDDVRRDTPHWDYFDDDAFPTWSARVDTIRAALTSDGRTLAQGALAWIWARSPVAIPIPGFRSAAQIEENAGARPPGRSILTRWRPWTPRSDADTSPRGTDRFPDHHGAGSRMGRRQPRAEPEPRRHGARATSEAGVGARSVSVCLIDRR